MNETEKAETGELVARDTTRYLNMIEQRNLCYQALKGLLERCPASMLDNEKAALECAQVALNRVDNFDKNPEWK